MKLSYFPQLKVVHTSTTYHGQLYVPVANWLLMVGTVVVAAVYNNTTSLGNAYGVCVMFVTFFDTCMVTLVAILVWRIKPYYVFLPWLVIVCMDGTYLSAALLKVPDGAWFTILLATILSSIFILWRFGKEQQWFAGAEDRFPTTHFVKTNDAGDLQLTSQFGGKVLSKASVSSSTKRAKPRLSFSPNSSANWSPRLKSLSSSTCDPSINRLLRRAIDTRLRGLR
jgi:KUP system potassium uptake protein